MLEVRKFKLEVPRKVKFPAEDIYNAAEDIYNAAKEDDFKFQAILEKCDDINNRNWFGSALHLAAQDGHLQAVRSLVEKGRANVNEINDHGTTPLHLASRIEYVITGMF